MKKNLFKPNLGSGDKGKTLLNFKKVKKTDRRIKLNALLDELNACLALARALKKDKKIFELQKELLKISAVIAGYEKTKEAQTLTKSLTLKIRALEKEVELPKKFLIFGDKEKSSLLNLARTKARLAELKAWEIGLEEIAIYLNRLSDYLFLLSIK